MMPGGQIVHGFTAAKQEGGASLIVNQVFDFNRIFISNKTAIDVCG
jgi:hypothetical protein